MTKNSNQKGGPARGWWPGTWSSAKNFGFLEWTWPFGSPWKLSMRQMCDSSNEKQGEKLFLSWFNSLHSSLIHQFEGQPYHCSASRLCCCAASSPIKSFPVLGKRLCPFGDLGRFPCNVAAHCRRVAEVLIRLKACVFFLRPLRVSLLCKAFNRENFPKTRAAKKKLVDNSTLWRAPPPYFPSYLLTKQRTGQSQSGCRSAPPLSSLERWRERRRLEKFQNTPADRESHLFQFWCSVLKNSEAKKKLPFTVFVVHGMPPPESGSPLILVGFAVFNRRVMQLASRVERDRARVGSSLVDFEGSFFFWYFRKKLRARATRNKENNNSGLIVFYKI